MSRPIKFRAWSPFLKRWLNDGALLTLNGKLMQGILLSGSDYILMQFTGLHDKNGKEIYPQDIIKWSGWRFPVDDPKIGEVIEEWGKVGPCSGPNVMNYIIGLPKDKYYQDGHKIHNLWNLEQMEVIGNIYENPELLKGDGHENPNR